MLYQLVNKQHYALQPKSLKNITLASHILLRSCPSEPQKGKDNPNQKMNQSLKEVVRKRLVLHQKRRVGRS